MIKRKTLDFYCNFFGYDSVVFSAESAANLPAEILNYEKFYVSNLTSEAGKKYLQVDCNSLGNETDFLSFRQFMTDLENFDKIPEVVLYSATYSNFLAFLKRILNNFKKRGWKILLSVRKSLEKELPEYPSFNRENITDLSDGKLGYFILNDGNSPLFDEVYADKKNQLRLDWFYLMYAVRAWTSELLLNHYENILAEKGVSLLSTDCAWGYDNYLGKNCFPLTSAKIDERKNFAAYNIAENPESHKKFLAKIFECNENDAVDFFKRVSKIPPIMNFGSGLIKHTDVSGEMVNVLNGIRRTTDTPSNWTNTIWLLGGCVVFGYATSDNYTFASYLQRHLNSVANIRRGGVVWRVVNLGTWGGTLRESYARLETLPLKSGDIFINFYSLGPVLQMKNSASIDISEALNDENMNGDKFWDRVYHCNHYGYDKMSKLLMDSITNLLDSAENKLPTQGKNYSAVSVQVTNSNLLQTFNPFIEEIKNSVNIDTKNKIVGAIVMNCNPFTLGHRFLIEYAASKVDFLYVFVVEEDKSFFKFEDRIKLVKAGVGDISNVYVLRSGKMMISSLTFPSYFMKDNPKEISADSGMDVEIFGAYIAPALNISVRFVGEEPFDAVTKNYNENMKSILPGLGVKVIEIPRRKIISNGAEIIVSASLVRKYLQEKNFTEIKKLVPKCTYEYLINFNKGSVKNF